MHTPQPLAEAAAALDADTVTATSAHTHADRLVNLLERPVSGGVERVTGSAEPTRFPTVAATMIGELIALREGSGHAIVTYPGRPGNAALLAKSCVDLRARHIGAQIVLAFDNGDPLLPIVVGVVRCDGGWPLTLPPGRMHLDVDVDGERLCVTARNELVLQCGASRIRLECDGTIHIEGERIVSRANGVNRIVGASVELN